jgi:CheY-like chemotaxis protein
VRKPKLPRVLCVDDEPQVLSGLERNLRKSFPVCTAVGGEAALALLRKDRDFAVIVSDMRMPGMDGAAFLAAARLLVPDATRVLLTGQADLDAVVAAVNGGSITHYLRKPVEKDELLRVIHTGFAAFHESAVQRSKGRKALGAALGLMQGILAKQSPELWGQAVRVKRLAVGLWAALDLGDAFALEVVAGLACLLEPLDPKARAQQVGELLSADDSLEGARLALGELWAQAANPSVMARVVRAALRVDALEGQTCSPQEREQALVQALEPRLLQAFRTLPRAEVTAMPVYALEPGMVLARSLVSAEGRLVLPRGAEVTAEVVAALRAEPVGAQALVSAA